MRNYFIPPDTAFYIGEHPIKFYGIIMSLAMLVGVFLAIKLAKKKDVKSDDILLLALILLPCAVVGARLYYCIFDSRAYSFIEFIRIWDGGLAIYGGVIGGIIGILIFCAIKKDFKLLITIFDICVPCLILGQAIGRWGNFFNQEAYGNLVTNVNYQWFPYAVYIESLNEWHQATFFYESLWNLIGFVLLLGVYYRTKKTGTTTAVYLIWYGIGRTFIEGLRADSLYLAGTGIRVSQVLSALLVAVGVAILVFNVIRKRKEQNGQKV